jgi:hypothetical protein
VTADYLQTGSSLSSDKLSPDQTEDLESAELCAIWKLLDADQRKRLALTAMDMLKANGMPFTHAEHLLRVRL